jgi:hypothetical protein
MPFKGDVGNPQRFSQNGRLEEVHKCGSIHVLNRARLYALDSSDFGGNAQKASFVEAKRKLSLLKVGTRPRSLREQWNDRSRKSQLHQPTGQKKNAPEGVKVMVYEISSYSTVSSSS